MSVLRSQSGCGVDIRHPQSSSPVGRGVFGRRYQIPTPVSAALVQVFDAPVGAVKVIEYSRYAQLHLGMTATTRPNRIFLAVGGEAFISNPELLLHEYFHVLRQWNMGRLTGCRYLLESARCGYWNNRFEQEAREFAAGALESFLGYLQSACEL